MQVQFIASVSVVTPDPGTSRGLYVDAIGLPLEHAEGDEYLHSEQIAGSRHFGVWPLRQAAQACFGTDEWPTAHPVPQACVEFEVADADAVARAADELDAGGHRVLHGARREPWGQTVARLLSPEGLVIGISYTPWMR
jgi:catechol 2,3-dioxygenase-like lactoylglutathione lyase family enzyme